MTSMQAEEYQIMELNEQQLDQVDGGFVCGGLCVLGGISAGIAFLTAGITVGEKLHDATQ